MLYDYKLMIFAKWYRIKSDAKYCTIKRRLNRRKINYLHALKKKKNLNLFTKNTQLFNSSRFLKSSFFFLFFFKKLSGSHKILNWNFFSIFRLFFLKFSPRVRNLSIYYRLRKSFLLSRFFRKRFWVSKKRFKYFKRFKYYTRRSFYLRRKRFFKYYYFMKYKKRKEKLLIFPFLSYRYRVRKNFRVITSFFLNIFTRLKVPFFFLKKYLFSNLVTSSKIIKKKLLFFVRWWQKKIFVSSLLFSFLKRFRKGFLRNYFLTFNLLSRIRSLHSKRSQGGSFVTVVPATIFFRKFETVIKNSRTRSKRLFFRFLLNRRINYREKNKRLFKISYQLVPRFYLMDEFFFNSFFISKFIANLVKNGKKAWARRLTYSLFALLKHKFKIEIIFLFMRLLSVVLFPYDLVKMHRGKSVIESPVLLLASQVVNRTLLVINMNLRALTTGSLIFKYFTIFNDYFFLQQGFLFSKMSDYIEKVDDLRFLTIKKYSYRLLKNFI
ncbi:MAG: hypothetical protein KIT41_12625 [Pyrinomonadaceae bacterium]|nr:hypothetical protein [Pyrinomonadaceae bacterium]